MFTKTEKKSVFALARADKRNQWQHHTIFHEKKIEFLMQNIQTHLSLSLFLYNSIIQ
jgi:hypothetical protein